jgi:hypothetical protein
MVQGALIGFHRAGLGMLGGVTLALNVDVVVPFIERMLGTQLMSKEVYYISNLPSELQWRDVTDDYRRVLRAVAGGDDLSELARVARQSGGGAAL